MIAAIVVLVALAALCVGALWYLGDRSLTDKTASELGFVRIEQKDTDGDGLSDALETLWHTNPENPDTNEDGVSDGNSIEQNLDPVKPGNIQITDSTERIQALVQNALTKKNAPLISVSPTVLPDILTFKDSDLNITNTETVASITKYRDDVRVALRAYFGQAAGGETENLVRFLDSGDESALIALRGEEQKVVNLLNELAKITVPQSAVSNYLVMINSLGRVVQYTHYLADLKNEPLLAIKASQLLGIVKYQFLETLVPVNQYFIDRGIHEKLAD